MDVGSFDTFRSETRDIRTGEVQEISHGDSGDLISKLALIGPALWPVSLRFEESGTVRSQEVHRLDLSNLYTINRSWEAGCCPHLFVERSFGPSLMYWGELWAAAPDVPQVCDVQVPEGVDALIVAELETELTHVVEVSVNGRTVVVGRYLSQGQQLRIPVAPGDSVRLTGYYVPHVHARYGEPDPWLKNALIARFMSDPNCHGVSGRSLSGHA